jgi:GT2 family glycosyltransferase
MDDPKVFINILNWNGKEVLKDCLRSIEGVDYANYEVVVVDNGSTDGSQEEIEKNFPYVHSVKNRENIGVAEGQNIGVRYALEKGADYVFVLNNDTTLDRNILKELIKASKGDPKVGVAVPLTYSADEPDKIQSAGGMIDWNRGKCYHLQAAETENSVTEIDYLGSALIKRNVIEEVGLYDSRYFAYWEDTDFCTRVKRAGFKVVCALRAWLWHKGTYSIKKITGFYEYYFTRNRFWFMKRYATRWQFASFILWFFFFELWLRSSVLLFLRRKPKVCLSLYQGVRDGVLGRLNEPYSMPKEHA